MSEYQYYEFQAVDRPLSDAERKQLRALSSRARISATSFVNHYDYGDFRGDPDLLMERYFDLFVYLANWGSRRFSMRLPKRLLPVADVKRFLIDKDVAAVRTTKEHLILDVSRDEVDADDWDDGSGWLADIAPLRAEAEGGDLRVFYLIWLMGIETGDALDRDLEPLPGIAPLTPALEAFIAFFGIDPDLVAAAASSGAPRQPSRDAVAERIRALSDDEKTDLLLRLHDGRDPHLGAELRRRIDAAISPSADNSAKPRTVAELRAIANNLAAERERAAALQAEAARRRAEQEQAEAKKRRLEDLADRGEAAWRDVERAIEQRNPLGYERAVAILVDLRDLADNGDRMEEFQSRLAEMRARHEKKMRFLERLAAAGLD